MECLQIFSCGFRCPLRLSMPYPTMCGMSPCTQGPGRRRSWTECRDWKKWRVPYFGYLARTNGRSDCPAVFTGRCDWFGPTKRCVALDGRLEGRREIANLAKPQPRERAWHKRRGKKTLLSFSLLDALRFWPDSGQWWPNFGHVSRKLHNVEQIVAQR